MTSQEPTPDASEELPEQPEPNEVREEQAAGFAARHPFIIYSLQRLLLLIVSFGVLFLLGARGIFLILLAFLISAVAAYVLFARQRDQVGSRMSGYFSRMNQRIDNATHAEDEYVDSLLAEPKPELNEKPEEVPENTTQRDSAKAQRSQTKSSK